MLLHFKVDIGLVCIPQELAVCQGLCKLQVGGDEGFEVTEARVGVLLKPSSLRSVYLAKSHLAT